MLSAFYSAPLQKKFRSKIINSRLLAKVLDSVFLDGLIMMTTKSKRVTTVVETQTQGRRAVGAFVFKTLVELVAVQMRSDVTKKH